MAMSRLTIALSYLAALTFVSDASVFTKLVIYTILYTIARIDWSDIITAKTADETVCETGTESDTVDFVTTPQSADAQAVENIRLDDDDSQHTSSPAMGPLPELDTASHDTKRLSRASSISSTTSLFDKPPHNNRPSTPDTEIGDIPEFSTLAAKYQDDRVVNTECLTTELGTTTAKAATPEPIPPSQHRPPPPPPAPITSITKYSMKPTELVDAAEDLSLPITRAATLNKRNLDTFRHEPERVSDDQTTNVTERITPTQSTATSAQNIVPKKRKLNSRQRRQRALRQAAGSVGPSPLVKVE